ncbi:MAG: hypothetical protein DRJ50_05455, partial [Actinobacteria bacterium]
TTQTVYVDEGAGQVDLTVELSEVAPGNVFVYWNPNDASARMGLDYSGMQGGFDINQGLTTGVLTIPIFDDDIAEPPEVFRVTTPGANGAQVYAPAVVEVVIIDNDEPSVAFTSSTYNVGESAGTATVTVERIGEITGPETVDWATIAGGTATPGVDYETGSGVLNFDPATTSRTFEVTIQPDGDTEIDETLLLQLGNPSAGLMLGSPTQATLTILDDDGPPPVSFAAATASVVEVAGSIDLTVVLDRATDVPVDVQVDTADGSAVAGSDYTAVSQVVTIPATQTSGVVTIPISDDGLPEDDETFIVALSNPSGADLGAPNVATVTILGDSSLPSLSFGSATYSVNEHEGPAVLDVVLDEAPTTQVTVQVTSADDTAIAGEDYTAINEIVTFGIGETSKAVVVEISDDVTYEAGEDFIISLSSPSGANIGSPAAATVTINPSDWPPFVYLADGGSYTAQYTGFEHLGQISIPVRLSDPSGVTAEIDYATSAGTATPGTDYTETSGTITFDPGETEHEIVVPITDDGPGDNGETFNVTLSNPVECTLDFLLPDDANVTIRDDAWVALSQTTLSVFEDAGDLTVGVSLPYALPHEASVAYSVSGDTAVAGEDFTDVSGTVTFLPGSTNETFAVPILPDTNLEPDETFTVSLANPTGVPLGSPAQATATILDDELPEASVSSPTYQVGEDGVEISVVVTLSSTSTQDISLDYSTVDGSANGGIDYTATSGTLDILAGNTSGPIPISILDDSRFEGDETFSLVLSNPNNAVLRDNDTAVVTIVEDDQVGVTLTPAVLQTAEDGPIVTIDIVLTSEPSSSVTIGLSSTDTTEGTVTPSSVVFDTGNWDSPQQLTVTPGDDAEIDGDVTYSIETQPATSADPDYADYDGPDVSVTNEDDDLRINIDEPTGRFYGADDTLNVVATRSTVPPGYEFRLVVMEDHDAYPMTLEWATSASLTGSFTVPTTPEDIPPHYRVRMVVTPVGELPPTDGDFLNAADPCTSSPNPPGCVSHEIIVDQVPENGYFYPFTTGYVFPDSVLVLWNPYYSYHHTELERSEDGGNTWVPFQNPGGTVGIPYHYTAWADRTVLPGQTYHYRIKGLDSPHRDLPGGGWEYAWVYLGNTTTPPGDPVTTLVWPLPRPIPSFGPVVWSCPDEATRFQCLGTVSVTITPEPGESLIGYDLEVYVNEPTYEATGGNGTPVRVRWPQNHVFAGRDEPGCVQRQPGDPAFLKFTDVITSDAMTIDVPGVHYGANGFRFVVSNGADESERALLFGIHDEDGNHASDHDGFLPALFGTDISDLNYRFKGIGPVSMKSPDCADGDTRNDDTYALDNDIVAVYASHVNYTGGEDQVQTDINGDWEFPHAYAPLDGTLSLGPICFNGDCCEPFFAGAAGRVLLAEDRSTLTENTRQVVCPALHPTIPVPVADLAIVSAPTHEPMLSWAPSTVFSTNQDTVTYVPFRFRLTDTGQDLNLHNVTVTNSNPALQDPVTVNAFFMADQSDHSADETAGDWGWFIAEVPVVCDATCDNDLQIQASDAASNTLDTTTPVTRERPTVWAERDIFGGTPAMVEPLEQITIDAADSVAPALGETDGAVAKWVFFRYEFTSGSGITSWSYLDESPYLTDPEGLVLDYTVPPHTAGQYHYQHRIRGRLVIANHA